MLAPNGDSAATQSVEATTGRRSTVRGSQPHSTARWVQQRDVFRKAKEEAECRAVEAERQAWASNQPNG